MAHGFTIVIKYTPGSYNKVPSSVYEIKTIIFGSNQKSKACEANETILMLRTEVNKSFKNIDIKYRIIIFCAIMSDKSQNHFMAYLRCLH